MLLEDLMFLVLGGLGFLCLVSLGVAMVCSDLGTGMLFYYQDGGIYTIKTERRVADDTPENRRRISRRMGWVLIVFVCAVFSMLAFDRFFK